MLLHDVSVAMDGSIEVLQQTHRHAGAPRAVLVEEEPVFAFPPEIPVIGNAFFLQQALDGDALLAALRLDLFNLFSCKHVSLY